jgi:putative aldouronate transport system permease protein
MINMNKLTKIVKKEWQLYLLVLPGFLFFLIFHYIPMYGIQIAFKDFLFMKGIGGSSWVGLKHFRDFLSSFQFWRLLWNTLSLGFFQLAAGFPIPIILALLLNQNQNEKFKKIVQTITYAPHFISVVVLVGMLYLFLSPSSGIINGFIKLFGGDPVYFMGSAAWFKTIYVISGIWQNAGWGTIVYLAALSSVSPALYEAATIDGASRFMKIIYIDLFAILPTAVIMLILNMGRILSIGFQKVYLMQTPLNISSSEIISTYVYKIGLLGGQYSYSTAIDLFNTLINLTLIIAVNQTAKKMGETSIW